MEDTKTGDNVLTCACGDCTHWEIIARDRRTIYKCVTCGKEYIAQIAVDFVQNPEITNLVR